ncbi:MAG: hypothetical protein ACYDEI_03135 [Erysipelotrichaceae bacterium]
MKRYGLLKSSLDAHTLGINAIRGQLEECNQFVLVGSKELEIALREIENKDKQTLIKNWIIENKITHLGISYRLDPKDASNIIRNLIHMIKINHLFNNDGGPLKQCFFAGLPESCQLIENEHHDLVKCFIGSESAYDTLIQLGVEKDEIPSLLIEGSKYDEHLNNVAQQLIDSKNYLSYESPFKGGYPEFGTKQDKLTLRIKNNQTKTNLPLTRVHVGPYLSNREEAVKLFEEWCKELAQANLLDIVSIGSSQLTQSNFNEDWSGLTNGGGVPIQTKEEYQRIFDVSRPLLLRTYSGTKNVPDLAKIHEETINIAWHALSFWWFNQLDGRGPNSVFDNLNEHIETLKYIAQTNKPFEPNIPHHFAFRGSDDVTYVISAVLAARTAKKYGVKDFILQVMLNTPRYTWGIVDIAKARAILQLINPLKDETFNIFLQPRAGLDYFAPDIEKAKVQLAQVSMLMDDIEPHNEFSPEIIHVVSYSEALFLANPKVINESVQITQAALKYYREYKKNNPNFLMQFEEDIRTKTNDLVNEVTILLNSIEEVIKDPYTAQGLHDIFAYGYLQTPYLWANKEDFLYATHFKTKVFNGSTILVDEQQVRVDAKKLVEFVQSHINS